MTQQDTIQFFEKLVYKAERSLATALFRGREAEAENIRKKITHYRRALAALDPACGTVSDSVKEA